MPAIQPSFFPAAHRPPPTDDEDYPALTVQAKNSYHDSSNLNFSNRRHINPNARVGVSEGDSWFNYIPSFIENPFRGDLLAQLHHTGRYNIYNVAKAGDTLENMAYGTDMRSAGIPDSPELDTTIRTINDLTAAGIAVDFFLLSAGGNDMAGHLGSNLENYLNHHAADPATPLRATRAADTFRTFNKAAFQHIIDAVQAARPGIHIFLHGYDYAVPDGRSVSLAPPSWHALNLVGPWLQPAFARKRIPDASRQGLINSLIDLLNDTLADLVAENTRVHHINCRGALSSDPRDYKADWANELHPTVAGFAKIAERFDQAIATVLPPK